MPTIITHYDDGVDRIELHPGDLVFLFGHHRLVADGFVLVDGQVKHMCLWKDGCQPLRDDNQSLGFLGKHDRN